MKLYSATGDKDFKIVDATGSESEPNFVKLKVSLVLPTMSDLSVYEGKLSKVAYPRVPCRMATAIVSEDRPEFSLKRGAKVVLNPYIGGLADKDSYAPTGIYGIDEDGFLRDFLALPMDNIIPFPEELKEEDALFADMVAIALKVLNSMNLEKGDYLAIIGGSVLNCIIAQLALYYQAIPILVVSDERYIDIATDCGVYYTVNEALENVQQRVFDITGGRMADHTVLHALANVTPNFITSLAAEGSQCIVAGLNSSYAPRLDIDISMLAKKNLTIQGVTCGCEEFNSAVNMLAQKVLKLDRFVDKTAPLKDAKTLFSEMSDSPLRYVCPVIKV